jgi:hypothetical protein
MSDVLTSIIVLVVTALLVFRRELTASRGAKAFGESSELLHSIRERSGLGLRLSG